MLLLNGLLGVVCWTVEVIWLVVLIVVVSGVVASELIWVVVVGIEVGLFVICVDTEAVVLPLFGISILVDISKVEVKGIDVEVCKLVATVLVDVYWVEILFWLWKIVGSEDPDNVAANDDDDDDEDGNDDNVEDDIDDNDDDDDEEEEEDGDNDSNNDGKADDDDNNDDSKLVVLTALYVDPVEWELTYH